MELPKTALQVALGMAKSLPDNAVDNLSYNRHPQERTRAFHEVFGAPIADKRPDATFSHMDDQRVAFRASFILSEAFELLEKGLGLNIRFSAQAGNGHPHHAYSSHNSGLCDAILGAMRDGGRRDLKEVFDALVDLNVVVNGFAVELGVDMKAGDQECYASNLTKLDENGQPIVADENHPTQPAGKILKGPNFVEPQLDHLLGL